MERNQNDKELAAIDKARASGKRIVFTNGCFDLLHVGHLRYLADARNQGDLLVVGLNSDESVKRLKGHDRPIVSQSERKEMLLGLRPVDFVCIFEDDLPLSLIQEVRPDVLTKGGDWPVEKICGNEYVTSYGGTVLSLPFFPGHSSSLMIEKVKKL